MFKLIIATAAATLATFQAHAYETVSICSIKNLSAADEMACMEAMQYFASGFPW